MNPSTPAATKSGQSDPTSGPTPDELERSEQEGAVRAIQDLTPGQSERLTDSDAGAKAVVDATAWFLSEDLEAPSVLYFDIDVAAQGQQPKWIRWGVRNLSRTEVRDARKRAANDDGSLDDMDVNVQVVVAGSIMPDFSNEGTWAKYPSPGDALVSRFEHKPGAIEQLARKVNELSGYGPNAADIIRPVDAAGN